MPRVLQPCTTERELKKMFIGGVSVKLRNLRNKYWNQSRWKGSPNTEKPLFGSRLYYFGVALYYVYTIKSILGHKLIVGLHPLRLSNLSEFFPKFFFSKRGNLVSPCKWWSFFTPTIFGLSRNTATMWRMTYLDLCYAICK